VTELFVSAFVTLFVVIDPPGCAPIFAGLTSAAPPAQARRMAARACLIASLILLGFALFGEQLLGALHIELNSFRIAGGIMLFLIALEMVFEKRQQRREERAEKVRSQHGSKPDGQYGGRPERTPVEDISVFPLAIPMIAGPGSIATVMLLMSRAQGTEATLAILAALAAVMAICLAALLAAGPLMRLVGAQAEAVVTRLLGVLLAALAAQYVIDGLREAMG
jgi:multiple antibiotic resistance protein